MKSPLHGKAWLFTATIDRIKPSTSPSFHDSNFISTMPQKRKHHAKQKNSRLPSSSGYDPTTHYVKQIRQPPSDPKYKPLVCDESEMSMTTTFGPFHKDKIINVAYMCHYFFPDHIINVWTKCTNAYAKDNCAKSKIREVKPHHILQFFAIYYYMGVVCLPTRRDYWKQGGLWPSHPVFAMMSRDFFDYLFH